MSSMRDAEIERQRDERADHDKTWRHLSSSLYRAQKNRDFSTGEIEHLERRATSLALALTANRHARALQELRDIELALIAERRIAAMYDASERALQEQFEAARAVVEQDKADFTRERAERIARDAWMYKHSSPEAQSQYVRELNPHDREAFRVALEGLGVTPPRALQ